MKPSENFNRLLSIWYPMGIQLRFPDRHFWINPSVFNPFVNSRYLVLKRRKLQKKFYFAKAVKNWLIVWACVFICAMTTLFIGLWVVAWLYKTIQSPLIGIPLGLIIALSMHLFSVILWINISEWLPYNRMDMKRKYGR
jgi:hypothetical protein